MSSFRSRSVRRRLFLEYLESRLNLASTLSISDASLVEGNSGTTDMLFTVSRTGDTGPDVTFGYTTADSLARSGIDYTSRTGSIVIPSGVTSATINVPIIGDTLNESDETFLVNLTGVVDVRGPTLSLAPRRDFLTGSTPHSAAVGDFNGDGRPDIVVANHAAPPSYTGSSVSVLLNTTAPGVVTPSFANKQDFATGGRPRSVAVADLNIDGKPDLVVANNSGGSISVLLNMTAPGASTPAFVGNQDFNAGAGAWSLAIGDFNGDGRPDLVVANADSNSASVLLNTTVPGAVIPSFASKQDFAAGIRPRSVAVSDLNGDGKADFVVSNDGSDNVSVFFNTTPPGSTTPTFLAKQDFATSSRPQGVAIGDLNGDGKPDIVTANIWGNNVSLLLNTTAMGSASSSFAAKQDFGSGVGPAFVAMGDLNGDGKPDLVVANINDFRVSVLLNTSVTGANTLSFATRQDFITVQGPSSVSLGDFNGDGVTDLSVANPQHNSASIFLNTTPIGVFPATFATSSHFATGSLPNQMAAGDLNGDGKADMVVVNSSSASNSVSVLLNTTSPGAAIPSFSVKQDFPVASRPSSVFISDLNGDGKPDLVVSIEFPSNNVSVLLNTTMPGSLLASFTPKQDFATGLLPFSVAVSDMNSDGRPDIVAANTSLSSNSVSVLLSTMAPGASTPSFAAKQDFDAGIRPDYVIVRDLNGDGKPDIVVSNINTSGNPPSPRSVSVLLNTTSPGAALPSFATKQAFDTGESPGSVAVSDLNGDGKLDLAIARQGGVTVLLNTMAPGAPTPSFATKQDFTTLLTPYSVATGDLNGDGKPDLVANDNDSGKVSVLLNRTVPGSAILSFAAKQDISGLGLRSVTLADFNGDGKPDLAGANSNAVRVVLNTTVPTASINRASGTGQILNDDNQALLLSASSANENAGIGRLVGNFFLAEASPGTTSYTLVTGEGSIDNASFTIDANANLKTAAVFNYETKSSYSIRVRATNSSGQIEQFFNISVVDLPEIASVPVLGDGTTQRSLINKFTLLLEGQATVNPGAFTLVKRDTNEVVTTLVTQTLTATGQSQLTLTFSGPLTRGAGALSDGYYQLTIDGSKILRGSVAADLNGDGTGGDSLVIGAAESDNFFALFGDTNGDGVVGVAEFGAFRAAFGKSAQDAGYNALFDYEMDQAVGVSDFGQFRSRFGKPKLRF